MLKYLFFFITFTLALFLFCLIYFYFVLFIFTWSYLFLLSYLFLFCLIYFYFVSFILSILHSPPLPNFLSLKDDSYFILLQPLRGLKRRRERSERIRLVYIYSKISLVSFVYPLIEWQFNVLLRTPYSPINFHAKECGRGPQHDGSLWHCPKKRRAEERKLLIS